MPYDVRQLPQFEGIRQRQQNQQNAAAGTQNDALQRRFASMGSLNSGAAVKQQQIAADNSTHQNEAANQGIDFAEAQQRTSEDQRNQDVGFRDKQFDFQKSEADLNRAQHNNEFDKSYGLQQAQMGMDREAQGFNEDIAKNEQDLNNQGIVGSVLGRGGVGGTIGSVFGGGSRYFCTELYKRGLCSKYEMYRMSEFFFRCMWSDTSTCYFYAMNGKQIVDAANKNNFEWSTRKTSLIDDVIRAMDEGQMHLAKRLYTEQIKDLCLRFEETKDLIRKNTFRTTWADRINKLPKLVFTKTFRRACKIWLAANFIKRGAIAWR